MDVPVDADEMVPCPLLGRPIAVGRCLDINYQLLSFFKSDVLFDAMQETNRSAAEVPAVCSSCPSQPL